MSVLLSKRKVSNIQHLKELRSLVNFLLDRAQSSKRLKLQQQTMGFSDFYADAFMYCMWDHAREAYDNAVSAYSLTVNTKEDAILQHRLLRLSQSYINKVNANLGIYYDRYSQMKGALTAHEMEKLSSLVFNSAKLLAEEIKRQDKQHKDFFNKK